MPKRINNLFEKVCELDNIKLAILSASKGKTHRKDVQYCLANMDKCAKSIQKMLINRTFIRSQSTVKKIVDAGSHKEREIQIPKFYPDQIVHWSLMLILEPILRTSLIENSFASVKGRGTYKAQCKINKDIRKDVKHMKYYLKLDIKKCYPNIKKSIVIKTFRRKFKDEGIIWLVGAIIGDEDKGIPIGFYTSQWYANFVLSTLDKFILEHSCVSHYYRYLDDMIVFGNNKKELQKLLKEIISFANEKLELTIKNNYQLYNFYKQGLDFVGVRFFKNYSIMRKRNFKRVRRLTYSIAEKERPSLKQARSFTSYYGWLSHCDMQHFFERRIKPKNILKNSKFIIRKES